jgi:hypothetical protein
MKPLHQLLAAGKYRMNFGDTPARGVCAVTWFFLELIWPDSNKKQRRSQVFLPYGSLKIPGFLR